MRSQRKSQIFFASAPVQEEPPQQQYQSRQMGSTVRQSKRVTAASLDRFADEFNETPLNATYAGQANKKGGVYSRLSNIDSYTGVYKQRMDGKGINMASDWDARRQNQIYGEYAGSTNTGTDVTFHSIENMVTRR